MNEEELKQFNKDFCKRLKAYLDEICEKLDADAEYEGVRQEQERRDKKNKELIDDQT